MISENNSYTDVPSLSVKTDLLLEDMSDADAPMLISEINRSLEDPARRFWGDGTTVRGVVLRLLKRFSETTAALESRGWSAERIREHLAPSRRVFASSAFMRRCQEWPCGYAGDFETIECLVAGTNHSLPGTLGWHIEEILLQSPVVQQHRNKLNCQSLEIASTLARNKTARILSIACGGCLDWIPVLPQLQYLEGEIVLNNVEAAALELAERRLRSATTRYHLAPGNVIRVAKRLAGRPRFDLVVAGGIFDYFSDRAIVIVLREISQRLLAPGGILLFTNIAEGNPWRYLMEYGSNWNLIERSEPRILEICRQAGIPQCSVSLKRDPTKLTLITTVVQ